MVTAIVQLTIQLDINAIIDETWKYMATIISKCTQ